MKLTSRFILPVICLLALGACEKEAIPERAEVARPAKIFAVVAPGANYLRSFPGEVQATDQAELAFRVPGELVEFPATRGLQVKQGDLLARLDPSDYRAALQQARAQYELARSQFERVEELVERQLVSRADYDTKLAEMRVAESTLTRAQNSLDYTSIYAPFDGIVALRNAENFEAVGAGQVVVILQTGEMVDVIVDIPESIVARVERKPENRNPKPVKVTFDSIGDDTFEAHYKEHETQADPATLTYKVTFSMPIPEDINILPGMTATVTADMSDLMGDEAGGFQLPIEAVFAAEDQALESVTKYVWKVDPGTMRTTRQAVTVGALTGANIVVLTGLNAGDLVVSAGVSSVTENMLLRSMSREAGL